MDNLAAALREFAAGTLLALDLIGTFVFALSGAIAGVRQRLDIFGVLVLSFIASSAGGIMRDVLIGSVPPAAIGDWRYIGTRLCQCRQALRREMRRAMPSLVSEQGGSGSLMEFLELTIPLLAIWLRRQPPKEQETV